MEIRQLTAKDATLYKALRLEALRNHPEAFGSDYEAEKDRPIEQYAKRFESEQASTFGVLHEGELVGIVTVVCLEPVKMKHRANLFAMYVTPRIRKQQVGRRLVQEALRILEKQPLIEQVHLSVVRTNEAAKALYQSLGFQSYAIEPRALKIGDTYHDEELMWYRF
ncbi:N-acetyltransferase [Exiguobacterium acetylicum]|uniref:GNAT family N-acetyltransferase n=1 Tax=Exiguobacterium acetylicum TaxID=41170 RepID=UPI003977B282